MITLKHLFCTILSFAQSKDFNWLYDTWGGIESCLKSETTLQRNELVRHVYKDESIVSNNFFKAQVLEVPPATCVIVCLIPPLKTFFKVHFWNFVAYDVLGAHSDGCYDDYAYGCLILQNCVLFQTFYLNFPIFHTDLSAISVTFCSSE